MSKQQARYSINLRAENSLEQENLDMVKKSMDLIMKTPTAVGGSVMPDACPAGSDGTIPVGGVAVAMNAIHPAWHSADICCSLYMTEFMGISEKDLLDQGHQITHFGIGGRQEFTELPTKLEAKIKANEITHRFLDLMKYHLGTQGDGNHFMFVGKRKSTGNPCLVTHHGSRGPGAKIYKVGKEMAEKFHKNYFPNTDIKSAWIPADSDKGEMYWEALQIIREWTKLNHECLHNSINANVIEKIWNEHNFVFKEGNRYYHAKGATPLMKHLVPDGHEELRIVPLNMASPVLLVKGKRNDNNIGFCPHGAGRNMSRSRHMKNVLQDRKKEDVLAEETDGLDVRFFTNEPDISELPSAYKSADIVKKHMEEYRLCEVDDEIEPFGSIMAGHIDKKGFRKSKNTKNE